MFLDAGFQLERLEELQLDDEPYPAMIALLGAPKARSGSRG